MPTAMEALLAKVPASAVPPPRHDGGGPPRPIVTVSATDSPRDAYHKLADANIRSAPVWDAAKGKHVGFLDVRDLTSFIVAEERRASRAGGKAGGAHGIHASSDRLKYLDRLIETGQKFVPNYGVTVPYLARRHAFYSVGEDVTLDEVARLLSRRGCRRVPVVNAMGDIVNIISQSTLIDYLNKHMPELGEAGRVTVTDTGCGASPVRTVGASETVLTAFDTMSQHDIMGVAVVDERGHLMASTSASDIKEFLRDPGLSLQTPAIEFVRKVQERRVNAANPAISVRPTDTVATMVAKLAAARVHRIFVVDDSDKLVSVISLTDILRYLVDGDAKRPAADEADGDGDAAKKPRSGDADGDGSAAKQ